MLGTVVKAGNVLDLFSATEPEWGVSEVAERLQIPKSSAHGLLATLCAIGLLRRSGGRYRLGWRIVELNRALFSSSVALAGTRPVLRQLADQLGVTVELAALHHLDVALIDRVTSASVPYSVAGDSAIPVHTSAVGKVLLAHGDPQVIDEVCAVRESSSTPWCSTRFRSELNATRLRGLGYDAEASEAGLCSVAAPIRDSEGRVETVLGITAPALSFRRNREMLSRSVQRAAARISKNGRSPEVECDITVAR